MRIETKIGTYGNINGAFLVWSLYYNLNENELNSIIRHNEIVIHSLTKPFGNRGETWVKEPHGVSINDGYYVNYDGLPNCLINPTDEQMIIMRNWEE